MRPTGGGALTVGLLRRAWRRLVAARREYCVFTADAGLSIAGDTSAIQVYDRQNAPPRELVRRYREQIGARGTWWMFRRLRRDQAVFLALVDAGEMVGTGWVQRWAPMRREFWWLAEDAVALGPYWTHPAHRGRGIYGRLLARSLAECRRRGWDDIYIWADKENASSIRGIEKAGFRALGKHRVRVYLNGLFRRHETVEVG